MKHLFPSFRVWFSALGCMLQALSLSAGPADPVKSAHKSVFHVFTYDATGRVLGKGTGFFVSEAGEGVAAFHLFRGASRAEVVDYRGNRLQIARIHGAAENYDLVRFSTIGGKKLVSLELGGCGSLQAGEELLLIPYATSKKAESFPVKVQTVDDFEDYKYLGINSPNEEAKLTCPLLDGEGRVVAVTQRNVTAGAETACAIDARFIGQMSVTSASALHTDLQSIRIPKSLPPDVEDALTYIYMMGYRDSLQAQVAYDDFVSAWPDHTEGYVGRAAFLARQGQYAAAEKDYQTALQKALLPGSTLRADEVRLSLSKQIRQQVLAQRQGLPEGWTLQRAYEEVWQAWQEHPAPEYLLEQAQCLFAQKEYAKAYEKYLALCQDESAAGETWSPRAKAENWFAAARCLELSGGDSLQVVALMDSAVNRLERPISVEDARYLLERAVRLERIGQYRRAIVDYNAYELAVGVKSLNDRFYYMREQLEMECKMYQQALDDIQCALSLNPHDPTYPVEYAYVLLRAGLNDEVVTVCDDYIQKTPDNPDFHKFRGVALAQLGKFSQARKSLEQAKALGDPTAEQLIHDLVDARSK